MASATDYFMKVGRSTATTLSSPGYTTGDTSINVASTTNWPADTGVTFAIDEVDSNGLRVSGTYNVFRGKVAGGTQIDEVTYVGGDTNRNYSAGATTRVYILVSSYRDNRFTDGILEEHKQDGTHSDIHATSVTSTGVIEATEFRITGAGGDKGWSSGLPTPDTITYNGNRSYDLVFNSTDLTDTLSPGMRLRTTRTVTAPIQCTSLNGSNQYWSKSSPAGYTFTDDFTYGAWIKPSSYAVGGIIGRYNGSSGSMLYMLVTGQIRIFVAGEYWDSYQSVELNRWTHVVGTMDASGDTANVYINGVSVPIFKTGTASGLTQAGNLEVGSFNGGTNPFPGKIAQAFVAGAIINATNVRALMSQGITSALITSNSIISAYDFNNSSNDLNTTNANNLTASGSATATNADSPFALGNDLASAYTKGTTDFGVVMATSFSTNTTVTVQVPEGCTIPTSGGISAIYYSSLDTPYGFPRYKGRWVIETLTKIDYVQPTSVANTWYNIGSTSLSIPIGCWRVATHVAIYRNTAGPVYSTLSTANNTESNTDMTAMIEMNSGGWASSVSREGFLNLATQTTHYLNTRSTSLTPDLYNFGGRAPTVITAECAYV